MEKFNHRAGFGVWINDLRESNLRLANWPYIVYDDEIDATLRKNIDLMAWADYNELCLWGLHSSWSWSENFEREKDIPRLKKINDLISFAHFRGIKILYGLGVYSWGYDNIIRNNPHLAGTNPNALCGSKEESFDHVAKIIDFIFDTLDVDGVHLESADLGGCNCEECSKMDQFAYHVNLNIKVAKYIRSKWPDKVIMVNIISWQDWQKRLTDPYCSEINNLVELSKHVDYIVDPGHHGHYIPPSARGPIIERMHCDFGTGGGSRMYYCPTWYKLRTFLPYSHKTYNHLVELFNSGGRACEIYMGPLVNPGTEMNTAMQGLILSNPTESYTSLIERAIEYLYGPYNDSAVNRLVNIFEGAEAAWNERCNNMAAWPGNIVTESQEMITIDINHLQKFMHHDNWDSYGRALAALSSDIMDLIPDVRETDKLVRMLEGISNTLLDISQDKEFLRYK